MPNPGVPGGKKGTGNVSQKIAEEETLAGAVILSFTLRVERDNSYQKNNG